MYVANILDKSHNSPA